MLSSKYIIFKPKPLAKGAELVPAKFIDDQRI
jgi:hypothetical protein